MNLIIDEGNTLVKTAVFQNDRILEKHAFDKKEFSEKIEKIFQKHPGIDQCILSSVGKEDKKIEKQLQGRCAVAVLDSNLKLPFINRYSTPHTLGKDRIALICAAVHAYPGKNVLVIDAGTCITLDFKSREEIYFGGAISPGMQMRFKALHKFTANLPLVTFEPEANLIGKSTEESIRSGIINGIRMELKGLIAEYEAQFEDLTVIFTGGDSQFLSLPLKNSIFANSNFLLEGLNFILEFNRTQ